MIEKIEEQVVRVTEHVSRLEIGQDSWSEKTNIITEGDDRFEVITKVKVIRRGRG